MALDPSAALATLQPTQLGSQLPGVAAPTSDTSTGNPALSPMAAPKSSYYENMNNALLGADLVAQQQGARSLSERVTDFAQKGLPLIATSVFNSFANTALEVGNAFGGDHQKFTIEDEFGPDSDTTAYYKQNAGVIEGLGLAAGSLIPGTIATKVFKAAQATGEIPELLSTATGLFSRARQGAIDAAAVDLEGNSLGTSLFGINSVNKVKAVLAGAADSALQGAVYQTATLATMKASPLLDNNTLSDNVSDVLDAMKGFGLVGGIVEGAQAISLINKAARTADLATKAQETVGSFGLGNLTPGDRVVSLVKTLDRTPKDQLSRLAQMKQTAATNTTNRQIQEQLIKAAGGDEELAGAFGKFLQQGIAAGDMTDENLGNLMSQLTKIGRHGNTSVASEPADVFYLPRNIAPADVATIDHQTLMSKTAAGPTVASKALLLRDPNTMPVLARGTDTLQVPTLTAPSGATLSAPSTINFPKYTSAADAWKQGADIYVDTAGKVSINPDTTAFKEVPRPGESRILTKDERAESIKTGNLPADSKPLNAVGLTLDLTNGKLFGESPLPVVGDIAKPKLAKNGLQVGDTIFPHTPTSAPDVSTLTPMEANSRYVWSALRGIQRGDQISSTDLPQIEQLYREMRQSANPQAVLDSNNLTHFTNGSPIPSTPESLLQHIADTKQGMLGDLLMQGKNADEIGHILNSPQKGISTMFNTSKPEDIISDPAASAQIKHVRLAYDIGTTRDSEGNLLRGLQMTAYRTQLAKEANTNAVSNYLSKIVGAKDATGKSAGQYFSALQFTKGIGDADIAGAGAGILSNANADYGTLAQQAERIGRSTSELALARRAVVSDTLAPGANALRRDPKLAAEFGNFVAVRHSTGENYVMLSDADAAANNLPKNTAVLERAVTKDPQTGFSKVDRTYLPSGFVDGSNEATGLKNYYTLSPEVADFERSSQSLNNVRNDLRQTWNQAQGISKPAYNPDVLYAPPINGVKYPFMAYVKQRDGYALGESGASVVTARSAAELQQKISLLGPSFDAFTKDDIANFKKAQGEYEFSRNFAQNKANTELARRGILNNVVPETRAENLINDLAGWHNAQETTLLRDHVELHNAQMFAQLRAMGDRFDLTGTSRFGAITPFVAKTATNPYSSYIRTALGLTNKDNYPLWQLAQEKLQAYGDAAFNHVKSAFGAMQKGLLPPDQAAAVSEKFGLGNPYGTAIDNIKASYYGGLANKLPDPQVLSKFVATANSALGATVIRLDNFQQLIHAVTTPIMTSLEYGSAARDLQKLLSVTVPGTKGAMQVPGFARVMYRAVNNYFGKDYDSLANFYKGAGLARDELDIHKQMIDSLSMPLGSLSKEGWAQKIQQGAAYAERLSGSRFVNRFNHFIVADIGRQLGEASGQKGQDLLDTIGTFTNRVQGNMSAGQRAIAFTGPVGQAVGLFQSYQMNMMQQLLRHIGDGDVAAIATGAAMQSTIFGVSSLPGFSALNSLIQQRHGNTSQADLYSGANDIVGHDAADYLLYGSLSGLLGSALYSRGDLNPRRASILPVNPLNFPSVAAGIRAYQTIAQLASNVSKGGSVPASLLLAAEHNGLSRPLTGLAEMMQGFSTNTTGNLISAQSSNNSAGYSDLFSIANMSRILGARPLDEAVGLDALYRSNAAKVTDSARIATLGDAAKTAFYGNQQAAPDQVQNFMSEYTKAGGNQAHFNQWMLGIARDANTSTVNRVFNNLRNPTSDTLQRTMGGQPIEDFSNNGSTAVFQPGSYDGYVSAGT